MKNFGLPEKNDISLGDLLFFFKATGLVFMVLILVACSSSPANNDVHTKIEVVNGTPISASAKVGVRFDTGPESYRLLPAGKEQILLEGYEMRGLKKAR